MSSTVIVLIFMQYTCQNNKNIIYFFVAELLQNSDMESDFQDNWFCHKDCTLKSSSDSYTGHYSVKVSNR